MADSLETILRDIEIDALPQEWQWRQESLKRFSGDKSLFSFQKKALENALKTLWLFYGDKEKSLDDRYRDNQIQGIKKEEINRMGFWMATGSGKTLVIIKTIEMLSMLMAKRLVSKKDIMFLVYRDNLLDQFKKHVDEYNTYNPDKRINLIDLKKYEQAKHENPIAFSANEVNVFYYRADLFFERRSTAKKIDPNSCDNNGEWFVLLDEAHRGESGESTYKDIYNKFARNGFIFNFSATFTDDIDLKTCANNFNLEKFIQEGYGKQIYVSGQGIEGFRERDGFRDIDKRRAVLKTLILQAYINQHYKAIREVDDEFYHKPLLLTITNTVQEISSSSNAAKKKQSDLKLFFSEIEKIAGKQIEKNLFNRVKDELCDELKEACYLFGNDKIKIDNLKLFEIEYKDILEGVYNTNQPGKIEVISIRGNNQEIAFKMTTSDKPFALIRIGDTSKWMNDILRGYEITQRYADDSFFESLNDRKSNINILMGSRTFYEGWDSNRPNIILFVNIGLGKDSKKFVLQSVGRGVRIEPEKGKRKRLQSLSNANEIEEDIYAQLKAHAPALESLFIFGTDAGNLSQVIGSLKDESSGEVFNLGDEFAPNPDVKNRSLFVPSYKESRELLANAQGKYLISSDDLVSAKTLFDKLDDKILLAKYGSSPKILEKTRNNIEQMTPCDETRSIGNPEFIASRLLDYFSIKNREFEKFNELKDKHIVNFKTIKFTGTSEDYQDLKAKINTIKSYPENKKWLDDNYQEAPREEYNARILSFRVEEQFKGINIKYLANHYYHPLLVSVKEKIDYLTHIIDVGSEIEFIDSLESRVQNLDSNCDWWMFSKLDETVDEVYIPYYNGMQNTYSKFNPDFIFWIQKGNEYSIIFVDPKGTSYTDYEHKADGYTKLFGEPDNEKVFNEHGTKIKVYLKFFGHPAEVGDRYKPYWINSIDNIINILF